MNYPDTNEILVHVFGRTDVGRTREHNEDAFVVADLTRNDASLQPAVRDHRVGEKGTLFMVADGMGGAAAGEIASQMATEIVLKEMRKNWIPSDDLSAETFAICLKRATQAANAAIHGYASSHTEFRGMGTTATIAGLLADTLYLCQVGDSRGYLVRDGTAKLITKDQSLMQKLIEAGELTEEEAAQSERRNIILQALGPESNIKVDLTYQRLRRNDVLVLCSDGLSGQVTKDQIAETVVNEPDLVSACKRLIDLANQAGGPDNITVIIARFDGMGLNDIEIEGDEAGHRVFSVNDGSPPPTPPPGMERISEGPTQPMRPSGDRDTMPVEKSDEHEAQGIVTDREESEGFRSDQVDVLDEPAVNPERRSAGKLIMFALLTIGFIVASYFGVQMLRKVPPDSTAIVDSLAADSLAPRGDTLAPAPDTTLQPPSTPRTP